jgi:hypothetical protein
MAHGEPRAQITFDRHLPFWRQHEVPIFVVCPSDLQVRTGLQLVPIGKRQHHGAMANSRMRLLLKWLGQSTKSQWVIIHEYDSLCLSEVPGAIWEKNVLWANVFPNNDRNFKGRFYFHPPLLIPREILTGICRSVSLVSDDAEHGFWDRWLGLVCQIAAIPFQTYGTYGFSRNTIQPHDLPEAILAIRAGARMIHGIKDPQVLAALDAAANDSLSLQPS